MPQHWYIARNNELMIDLDHHNPDAPPIRLTSARARLLGAMRAGKLNVHDAWLYPSDTPKHYHMVIRLLSDMNPIERHAWEFYLRDDPFRVMNNLMRSIQWAYKPAASLLITSQPYRDFYRGPDYACLCREKHSRAVMESCPIARQVRGEVRAADYFGKPATYAEPIRFGRMELEP